MLRNWGSVNTCELDGAEDPRSSMGWGIPVQVPVGCFREVVELRRFTDGNNMKGEMVAETCHAGDPGHGEDVTSSSDGTASPSLRVTL